ncbi:type VI secretion system tip protein VgrG [Aquabacterium sp. A7-Y]|uniref:type VI secretion system Vgr family protein n=1 Tax=Aquabacterium sp. A7-Y TaxID=1349605 RepID=UPI00223D7751|nr:type VI secretion system tip protein VgrG [Aquabacterium sp. A7-Y]MCW7541340.1 type VI secretion system tip protein VgrG [Aquabacterium sp. A7-Y]
MPRVMDISTPLGEDVLLFRSMNASEELGRLFELRIELLSERDDIDPDDLLGKKVTVRLELPAGVRRCFNGYVTRFGLSGHVGRYHRYRLTARPWLWLLTRNSDCRIFQNQSVPDILQEIFDKYPSAAVENRLTGSYRPKDYCVQYRETDFNFVSRLMEQEGIYYFFEHQEGRHTLVLADGPGAHQPFDGYHSIPFIPPGRRSRLDQDHVDEWSVSREIQPGAFVLDDFDFEKPSADLRASTRRQRRHAEAGGEFYDYPGDYRDADDGEHYARVRLEELQARHEGIEGAGNARGIAVGSVFRLTGQARGSQQREYLVTRTALELGTNEHESRETPEPGAGLRCSFGVLDSRESFRPQRLTPRPVVQGPQTAIVVGPSDDEIHTDAYGRVKVQFHWDRRGGSDENSSCWVRVSHPWAGKNFGMIAIPRIGQEVIVDFLEGDPDCPVVTGRVYNKEHMPPWTLNEHKTRSGIVTRSSEGGSSSTANELRFEDKKGEEEIFVHAERQLRTEVEAAELRDVGADRTTAIHGNDRLTVDKSRYEHVKGDFRDLLVDQLSVRRIGAGEIEEITDGLKTTIKTGGHEHTVSAGGQTLEITGGLKTTVKTGGQTHTVDAGGQTIKVTGNVKEDVIGRIDQSASLGIGITTPQAYSLKADGGVTINAPSLTLLGGATVSGATPKASWWTGYDGRVIGAVTRLTLLSYEAKLVTLETKGLSMLGVTYKSEHIGIKEKKAMIDKATTALELKNIASAVKQGAIALSKYSTFIVI